VGPPFFNAVFIPLMAPLIVALAIGPLLPWKRGDLGAALKRLWLAAAAAIVAAVLVWTRDSDSLVAIVGIGLAAWLFVGALTELATRIRLTQVPPVESIRRLARLPRSALGMTLAHAGLAVAIVGMTAAAVWKEESIQVMTPGDSVALAGYQYTFEGARSVQGPNYVAVEGTFTVRQGESQVSVLKAEKRRYPVEQNETTEAAIYPTFWGDLYAVIGEADASTGGYVTRIYFNPLVGWIWAGVFIMVVGGLFSLSDRRHRVGAPVRHRRATQQALGAAAAE
jgi:cytochrome c-type biogenesis protein CcmF